MERPRSVRLARALWFACLLAAALCPAFPLAQSPSECVIGGTIASGATPLPGVVVSLVGADGQTMDVSSSAADGSYALRLRDASRSDASTYTLKAELVAFAAITRELNGARCQQRVDLTMTLASRVPRNESAAPAAAATPLAARTVGGRGRGAAPAAQPFQSLELVADQSGLARPPDNNDVGSAGDVAPFDEKIKVVKKNGWLRRKHIQKCVFVARRVRGERENSPASCAIFLKN